MINTLFGYKIYTRIMITVIRKNIDKVSGFPDIVLIGYTLHFYRVQLRVCPLFNILETNRVVLFYFFF